MKRFQDGNYQAALTLSRQPALAKTALADYAAYYKGLAQLRLGQVAEARRTLDAVIDRKAPGYVSVAAGLAAGEAAETGRRLSAAVAVYERIADQKAAVTDDVLSRLGRAALAAGDRAKAAQAFLRVYYEFPLTDAATRPARSSRRSRIRSRAPATRPISAARRCCSARAATTRRAPRFRRFRASADGRRQGARDLRIAECDFNLKRYAAARDGVQPYLDRASRKAEARFFYLSSLRELGDDDQYVALTRALVAEFPDSSWSEEALNNLGTYYILTNEDELAAKTFRELYEKFPGGPARRTRGVEVRLVGLQDRRLRGNGPGVRKRGARLSRDRTTGRRFSIGPARAHGKLGERAQADARLRLVYTDYAQLLLRPARGAPARVAAAMLRPPPAATSRRASRRADAAARRQADPDRAAHPPAAGQRAVRRCAGRAAICAAGVGQLAARSMRRSPGSTTRKGSCAARSR